VVDGVGESVEIPSELDSATADAMQSDASGVPEELIITDMVELEVASQNIDTEKHTPHDDNEIVHSTGKMTVPHPVADEELRIETATHNVAEADTSNTPQSSTERDVDMDEVAELVT